MIDELPEPGRVDLRALAEPIDPLQAERVVRAALARAPLGAAPSTRTGSLAPLLAAAALLLLGAGLLLRLPRRVELEEPASLVAGWAASNHVPTNGELLAAFGGYQP